MTELRKRYGTNVCVIEIAKGDDEELVDISKTSWYRSLEATATPGRNLRVYRENRGLTQKALAETLGGGMKEQHVSNMENDSRPISKKTAKRLAEIFSCSVDRFI